MNGGDILFDALNGVSDCFVLEAGDLLRIGEEKPHGRGKAPLSNKSAFFFCIWSWPAPKEAGAEYAHHGQTRTRLLRKGCRRPSADRSLPLSPLSSGRLFPAGKAVRSRWPLSAAGAMLLPVQDLFGRIPPCIFASLLSQAVFILMSRPICVPKWSRS